MRSVAVLGETERVYGPVPPEYVDVPERDGERDAGHLEFVLEVDVVRNTVRMGVVVEMIAWLQAGEYRPHETLGVVVTDVDQCLAGGELRRGRDVAGAVERLVGAHVGR